MPEGIKVDSRIISVLFCPKEQISAKSLAYSPTPVFGVDDYAAKNACLFFLFYDIRIAQQVFLLVQIGERIEIGPIEVPLHFANRKPVAKGIARPKSEVFLIPYPGDESVRFLLSNRGKA